MDCDIAVEYGNVCLEYGAKALVILLHRWGSDFCPVQHTWAGVSPTALGVSENMLTPSAGLLKTNTLKITAKLRKGGHSL